jgi:hypothetical protein
MGQFGAENFNDVLSKKLLSYDSNSAVSIAGLYGTKNSSQTQPNKCSFTWRSTDCIWQFKAKIKLTK